MKLKHGQWTNWSHGDYGLNSPNGAQIIKEVLAENNIPAASVNQRPPEPNEGA